MKIIKPIPIPEPTDKTDDILKLIFYKLNELIEAYNESA